LWCWCLKQYKHIIKRCKQNQLSRTHPKNHIHTSSNYNDCFKKWLRLRMAYPLNPMANHLSPWKHLNAPKIHGIPSPWCPHGAPDFVAPWVLPRCPDSSPVAAPAAT
jgi:hypothetical protein